jgi:hypothetical protein
MHFTPGTLKADMQAIVTNTSGATVVFPGGRVSTGIIPPLNNYSFFEVGYYLISKIPSLTI